MGAAERRCSIMKILCRRTHETINNLATELGVSTRTIQRDIEILSVTEPIYTQSGRYYGGVYVVEGYSMNRMYMTEEEIAILQKLYISAQENGLSLADNERKTLQYIISQYSKPKLKNERIHL